MCLLLCVSFCLFLRSPCVLRFITVITTSRPGDLAETSTCHCRMEKAWSLLSLSLCPSLPHICPQCFVLAGDGLIVPERLSGEALESSLGSVMQLLLGAELGAHLARRILCRVHCGLPPLAAFKGLGFLPSLSTRMWCSPCEGWKFPTIPPHSAAR